MKEIELTNGDTAMVDDIDYEYLNQFKWHCDDGYAVRFAYVDGEWTMIYMHKEVMRRVRDENN